MNLIDELKVLAGRLQGKPAFSYSGKYEHNVISDDQDYSSGVVNVFEIEQFGFKRNRFTGTTRQRFPLFIEFVVNADQELTATQRNFILEEMKEMAAEYIELIDGSGLFEELPDVIDGITVVNRYDVNVVGVELNLVVVSKEPMQICV